MLLVAIFTAAGFFAGQSAERNAVRTEIRIAAVGVWGHSYEVRLVQGGSGEPVHRSAVYEADDHLRVWAKPEPCEGDLWLACAAAKLEAQGFPEAGQAPDAEVVVVTATRGGDVVRFELVGRLDAISRDRSVAPHVYDLLQYASTGQPKALRIIEPSAGPGSAVQFSPS